jgi:hypothetical protein
MPRKKLPQLRDITLQSLEDDLRKKEEFVTGGGSTGQEVSELSDPSMVVNHQKLVVNHQGVVVNHQGVVVNHQKLVVNHQDDVVVNHRKKDRHKRERVMIGVRFTPDMINKIKQFCLEKSITMTDFIELVVNHFFLVVNHQDDVVVNHQDDVVVNHRARVMINDDNIDDDIIKVVVNHQNVVNHHEKDITIKMRKTRSDIVILYEQYSGNKWKLRDDRVGQQFNNVDGKIIELGIIQTLFNAKGRKINSFAYFVPEIEAIRDAPFNKDLLDAYVKRRREQWQQFKHSARSVTGEEKQL